MNNQEKILQCLSTLEKCVVIKLKPNFPDSFLPGDDIDLVCENIDSTIEAIFNLYRNVDSYKLHIKIINNDHAYVDVYVKNNLIVRYDLYKTFNDYKRVKIKPHFFADLVKNSQRSIVSINNKHFELLIPSKEYEALIRFFEYVEYYWIGPDKIKHLEYIQNLSPSNLFFDNIHYYTAISRAYPDDTERVTTYRKFLLDFKKARHSMATLPIRLWPKKLHAYLKKICL